MNHSVLYRDRDLYSFVTSRFISTLAIQVQSVAIGWQVYDMERTPLALGLVGLCQFLPMFLLTLPAGDITDRFNQRRVYSLAAGLQATLHLPVLAIEILSPSNHAEAMPSSATACAISGKSGVHSFWFRE